MHCLLSYMYEHYLICIAILLYLAISHLLIGSKLLLLAAEKNCSYSPFHILSLKWSCGMRNKSPDIQSYPICFGSNDIFHIFLSTGPPPVALYRGRRHLHQLQPGPAENQPEPGRGLHV